MKHTANVTAMLIGFFLLAQLAGLFIISNYIDVPQSKETGTIIEKPLPLIERPEVNESVSWAYIFAAIILGTVIALGIIKLRIFPLWKFWFFMSVWFCLTVAFFPFMELSIALVLAFALTMLKVYRPNIYTHNLTEIFIYGGLAAIFVFFMNLTSAFILLFAISLYDMFSVWQSKHMIKLAEFQTSQKLFAGVFIPYSMPKKKAAAAKGIGRVVKKTVKMRSAILGGGDIGFPLIFSGVVFKSLLLIDAVEIAFLKTTIISITAAIALLWLFMKAEKDKYYPAMPFISIGCAVGYLIVIALSFFA
jgi:presenilin-like A22 family membrane protease